jgi:hypothetical protein
MTTQFNDLHQGNKQTLDYIEQLQTQEQLLYDSLSDSTLTTEQKQQNIKKINEIAQMRLNLYSTIKNLFSNYQKDLEYSQTTLDQQLMAINVIENQLNQSKLDMNLVNNEKYNRLRLIEINTYYGKRYSAYATLMKTIFFICIPVVILSVIANKGLLPPKLYVFLTGIVLIIGVFIIGLQIIDISNRDNMNWDEYRWFFDKNKAPSDTSEGGYSNPWQLPSLTCVGDECCYEGSTYDNVKNICVPDNYVQ